MTDEHTLPHKVLIKRGEFVDYARPQNNGGGRVIPWKLYYPEPQKLTGKIPVILWSHGFGGNRDGAGFISRHVAAHGYAILHLTHIGSDSSLWEGKKAHPWEVLRKISINRDMTLDRFADVPFALSAFEEWARRDTEIGPHLNFTNPGISGHSFGALTTQAMAGQLFPDADGNLTSFREPRFKAGILYSPVPTLKLTAENPEPHIYGPIAIPLFHMTGTNDESPLEGFGYDRRMAVHDFSGLHGVRYLKVLQGGDHMVYNGTRGQLEANPLRPQHEAEIMRASLAFWDYYLKGDGAAKAVLATYKSPEKQM